MKYKINLLSLRQEKPLERIIYFMFNYLRYILVITQIVVIGVFFYRFKVDQDLVDLQEAVDQKKEIIQVSQPLINEAKKEAVRINQLGSILAKQDIYLEEFDYILSLFPESFFLNKIRITNGIITMGGYTQDPLFLKKNFFRIKKKKKKKKKNRIKKY